MSAQKRHRSQPVLISRHHSTDSRAHIIRDLLSRVTIREKLAESLIFLAFPPRSQVDTWANVKLDPCLNIVQQPRCLTLSSPASNERTAASNAVSASNAMTSVLALDSSCNDLTTTRPVGCEEIVSIVDISSERKRKGKEPDMNESTFTTTRSTQAVGRSQARGLSHRVRHSTTRTRTG